MKLLRHLSPTGPAYAALRADGSAVAIEGDLFGAWRPTENPIVLGKRLAPLAPTNIIGIGLNYRRHAEEAGKNLPAHPMWFMKTTGAVQNPGDPIVIPTVSGTRKVDYEGELAVVLGRPARNVSASDALSYIIGYTIANDVSARDWQFDWGGGQFNHAKSFDTFCPLGPVLVTPDELSRPEALRLKTTVNGEARQDSSTADLAFTVPALIAFLSIGRTLPAGTVILTGTPQGVGYARQPPVFLQPGDTVNVEIEGIGVLTNPVVAETAIAT